MNERTDVIKDVRSYLQLIEMLVVSLVFKDKKYLSPEESLLSDAIHDAIKIIKGVTNES